MTRNILKFFAITLATAGLVGCQDIGKGSRMVTEKAKTSVEDTKDAVERLLGYKPEAEEYKPIPYTFCYKVMQDIACYSEPLPEARGRLVGWQGRGDFNIKQPDMLPAQTALVRQPRAAETRNPIQDVLKPKKKEEVKRVTLEPVFIPEAPKVKGKAEKVVTIKVDDKGDDTLY